MAPRPRTVSDSTSHYLHGFSHGQPPRAICDPLPNMHKALVKLGMSSSASLNFVYTGERYAIEWNNVASAPRISEGKITLSCDDLIIGEENFVAQPFPPFSSGELLAGANQVRGHSSRTHALTATISYLDTCATGGQSEPADAAAKSLAANMREQVSTDVRFAFAGMPACLWISETVLSKLAPLFETALSSTFAEGVKTDATSLKLGKDQRQRAFDDSDDETDDFLDKSYLARIKERHDPAAPAKTIKITETAYSTYAATLLWLVSRKIDFAPLKSNGNQLRNEYIAEALAADPFLPAPVSPKSVYRLAHLLELDELKALALSSYTRQLESGNAAEELFGDVAGVYPDVRDVTLKYVVEYYTEVKQSLAWKEARQRADTDSLPAGAAHTAILLSERLK